MRDKKDSNKFSDIDKILGFKCTSENRERILDGNGNPVCRYKPDPKKKAIEEPCQGSKCPYYLLIPKTRMGEKEQKIREYLKEGKTKEFILKNTPCGPRHYHKIKKIFEDEEKQQEHLKKEEELRESQITEPIKELDKITQNQEIIVSNKLKAPARNRIKPTSKDKILHIKLKLNEYKDTRQAIKYALDNYYRWTKDNITEMREYIKGIENNLNPINKNNEWLENARTYQGYLRPGTYNEHVSREEIYRIFGLQYYYPEWLKYLEIYVDLWEMSRPNEIRKLNLTIKEWFAKAGIDFPNELETEANVRQELEKDSNVIVETTTDFERIGIFEDLDHKIKHSLGIEDRIEYLHNNYAKLNKREKIEGQMIILTEKELKNHPYYVLLQEDIKYDENIKEG
jgi:hypothetical protein